MAPILQSKTQRWTATSLLAYFEETQVGLLEAEPEFNFYAMSPTQCAGYLIWLSPARSGLEAYQTACILKARSGTDTYYHWSRVVDILRGIQ